jgi:uncharacterized protein YutE (UPF0331/DUF86 family)/predicted nucleotidyltransferase
VDIVRVLELAVESAREAKEIQPSDRLGMSALRWEIYSSLQNLLDALAMIVADLGLIKPKTYADLGEILRQKNILTQQHAELIKKVALVRNTVAHAYRGDLIKLVKELLPEVEKLCMFLIDYVQKSNLDPVPVEQKFKEIFERNGVKLAYLFGSRSRESSREESDYDFALVLGRRTTVEEEIELALELSKVLKVPADLIDVLTLDDADPQLVYRVMKEGKLIYASTEEERKRWERHALLTILDAREFYEWQVEIKRIRESHRE